MLTVLGQWTSQSILLCSFFQWQCSSVFVHLQLHWDNSVHSSTLWLCVIKLFKYSPQQKNGIFSSKLKTWFSLYESTWKVCKVHSWWWNAKCWWLWLIFCYILFLVYGNFAAPEIPSNRPNTHNLSLPYVNKELVQHVLVSTPKSIYQCVIRSVLIWMLCDSLINQTQKSSYVSPGARICAVSKTDW